ncbi:MAG: hypothetical protein JHD16_06315 [Solirubrobacteraceae bacterium]|nr:hypothetical protein [Solirubrobacteraceae bacterium]
MDEKEKAARDLARIAATPEGLKKVLRPVKKLVFDMPRDKAALWVLERPADGDDAPYLDVLRFGACDFRETKHAHTMAAPVGWPRYMADEFERQGYHLAFQNLFVWHFGDFPDEATMVKRRRRRRGRPDVIIVQTGGYPAVRHVFGFNLWSFLARENFGRRLGYAMYPIWRAMDLLLRVFGRPAPWHGPEEGLEEFIEQLQRVWPGVPIEFWHQNDPVLEGFWVRSVADRLIEEAQPVLDAHDIPVVAAAPIPQTMALRGANGLNFNEVGSRAVGFHYANHLLARYRHLALRPSERAASVSPPTADLPTTVDLPQTAPAVDR